MEQTLGKRIMSHRKRLGLTQDQLAEKLGVTAQAVSKWENDQSCPDINMLPKLAEIFGISVDALLGREPQQIVHEGEVVDETEETDKRHGLHFQNGNLAFHFDNGKRNGICFALFVLVVGALLLAANILKWDVSFWDILWPSALLFIGLVGIFPKFSFFCLGCFLFGGYFLLSNLHVLPFTLDGNLVFPVIVLLFGLSLLVDALRKPKKPKFEFTYSDDNQHKHSHKKASTFSEDGEGFTYNASFSEDQRRIDLNRLSHGSASVSFGEYTVDLSGVEEVAEGCTIDADCSFGELTFLVPSRYLVRNDNSTAFASVSVTGQPDRSPAGVISMNANVSFGEIQIRYI